MKQKILAILDKSTNNGMKAQEIMKLLHNREADVVAKWADILDENDVQPIDLLHEVVADMTSDSEEFDDGE